MRIMIISREMRMYRACTGGLLSALTYSELSYLSDSIRSSAYTVGKVPIPSLEGS